MGRATQVQLGAAEPKLLRNLFTDELTCHVGDVVGFDDKFIWWTNELKPVSNDRVVVIIDGLFVSNDRGGSCIVERDSNDLSAFQSVTLLSENGDAKHRKVSGMELDRPGFPKKAGARNQDVELDIG